MSKEQESIADGALLHARLIYLCYFLAIGSLLPFLNLYYQRIGLTGVQIGFLSAIPPLVLPIVATLWSMMADAFRLHRQLLSLTILGSIGPVILLSTTPVYSWLALLTLVYALFNGPMLALVDSSALEVAEAKRRSYGELRAWGTLGWILSTVVVGRVLEAYGLKWQFLFYGGFMLLTFVASLAQPQRRYRLQGALQVGLRRLLGSRAFLTFLLTASLLSVTTSAVSNFLGLYIIQLGGRAGEVGMAWAIGATVELPVVFFGRHLLDRFGRRGVLILALSAFALRWFLMSLATTPGMILTIQLMHGVSLGAYLVAGVPYVGELAPEGLGTTALGVFNGTTFGIAWLLGSVWGGYLYDAVGMQIAFRLHGILVLLALALFLLSAGKKHARQGN